ncbi:hypothetical protein ONS95_014162 [Cadophora gregata]|uniref:uncharacterized protein n=1 Tax=Cadophora gregata TaxID=51156 RepID=UPI0026DADDE8|nr:uncharacterized protein ONS95_014162 [Cadophora gregata]KAK0113921.1 hypothetical protein ONS96_014770 [Cadophora gregata f. sp. sojae]KAK0114677.1 hypothetical protein ONS95_014162 [Cadophora gregata]
MNVLDMPSWHTFKMKSALVALCSLLLPSLAYAADGNLTITFFPSSTVNNTSKSSNPTCPSADNPQSSALTLTTASTPYTYTCFNLSSIFSPPNGSQPLTSVFIPINGYQPGQGASNITPYPGQTLVLGANYTILTPPTFYSPSNNYTTVQISLSNLTSEQAIPGKASGRRINVYSLPDCQQVSSENGGNDPYEAHPWYLKSCQTDESGDCRVVEKGILSFSIQEDGTGRKCDQWAFLGAGLGMGEGRLGVRWLVGVVGMVVGWIML